MDTGMGSRVFQQLRTVMGVRLEGEHLPASFRKWDQTIPMVRPHVAHYARGEGVLQDFKNDFVFVSTGERDEFLPDSVPDSCGTFLFQDYESGAQFFLNFHLKLLSTSQESRRLRSHIQKGCTSLRIAYFRVNKENFFPPSR